MYNTFNFIGFNGIIAIIVSYYDIIRNNYSDYGHLLCIYILRDELIQWCFLYTWVTNKCETCKTVWFTWNNIRQAIQTIQYVWSKFVVMTRHVMIVKPIRCVNEWVCIDRRHHLLKAHSSFLGRVMWTPMKMAIHIFRRTSDNTASLFWVTVSLATFQNKGKCLTFFKKPWGAYPCP